MMISEHSAHSSTLSTTQCAFTDRFSPTKIIPLTLVPVSFFT